MKKVYLSFMVLFLFTSTLLAQDARIWNFDAWEAVPAGPAGTNENWRGGGSGSTVALATEFPLGTVNFNFSSKVLKIEVPSDNGGLVFEGINPAFDRNVHNAVSFLIYAPGKADWKFEMMNSSSGNQWNKTIKTDSTTTNDWYELIFEIPATVAKDLTKFVIKPRNASVWGTFYIDDITFFKYIKPAPIAINIKNNGNLIVGKKDALNIDFTPKEEGGLVDVDATFESSNPSVATVSETGTVTAIAPGETIIKVTSKADDKISTTKTYKVVSSDIKDTYTAFDFETDTYVPKHTNYACEIVANPVSGGINTSAKVLKMTSNGGAWQWMNWEPITFDVDKVDKMTFKIFSETEIAAFNVEFGVGAGALTIASLAANTWTEISVNLPNNKGSEQYLYTFTKDKWKEGTIYIDDIMFVAGDISTYVRTTGIGTITGGTIAAKGGTLTLTAPSVSPANATNKEITWSISSPAADSVATIDRKTGIVTALKNGTLTVKATSRDGGYSSEATVTVSGQNVSAEKVQVSKTKLYPNPAKNKVYFSGDSHIERVNIFSLTGQNVLSGNVKENQFDISSLSKGIYLVNMISQENIKSITRLIVE
jgi:uncharacterized protein YjdB